MKMKEKLKNLSKRDKAIVAFWIVLFAVLLFQFLRVPRSELEEQCAEFTRQNGCMEGEEIQSMESGQRLYELIEGTAYDNPKEACGCVTDNITDP
ncbi:MAG: hypothetical protein ACLFQ8_03040 [Candidatus Aenigmatarchaeota archaeon]